ncbi:MAG: UDP-N-acetylmuramoyl-L-alanyl-D-glutamate--2,6-diaminopimelate ligase [Paenibacillaceae bacterium]
MRLVELAHWLATSWLVGDGNMEFLGVQTDSRKVQPGDLFVCISGLERDGHLFAKEAISMGAVALVLERDIPDIQVPHLFIKDCRQAVGVIASHFYGYPSQQLKLIGITGTNGKTTTTFIIDHILSDSGYRSGLMGTIHTRLAGKNIPTERTTQEALDLQRTLRLMVNEGAKFCAMEVSSHALELGRVKGCRFRTAIFTNLTQDHLDYHRTLENYRDAKGLLFSRLGNEYGPHMNDRQFAVLNADDPVSERYASLTAAQTITYGIQNDADVRATDIHISIRGTTFTLNTSFAGSAHVQMKLVGKFNVYNALGAIASTLIEGIPMERIVHSLEEMDAVDGRMQMVDAGQEFLVLVDYAHTPDGLDNALKCVREFATGRIITIFGCGGDRDRTKRSIMGRIATEYSDFVIVTSDNPRSEDPDAIISEIASGIVASGFPVERYNLVTDRASAIEQAIRSALPQDVILIAGKGHETYQILKDQTIDFDDRIIATNAIRSLT